MRSGSSKLTQNIKSRLWLLLSEDALNLLHHLPMSSNLPFFFTVLFVIQRTGVLRIIIRHTNNNQPGVDGISSTAVTWCLSGETNNGWCPSLKRPLQTQHLSPVEEKRVCCFQSFRSLTHRQMASFSLFSSFSAEKPEKQIERWTCMHVIMSVLADTQQQRQFRLWDQFFFMCFKTLSLDVYTIYNKMCFCFDALALKSL